MTVSVHSRTKWDPIVLGVPRGFVLGPLLCLLFTADRPSTKLIPSHSDTGHIFADDVQAYVRELPSAQLILVGHIQEPILHLHLKTTLSKFIKKSAHLVWNSSTTSET